MSQRQTIIDAIGDLLATMRTSNGYSSNGGLNLHKGLTHPLESCTLPAYAWGTPNSDISDAEEIGRWEHNLTITVESCDIGEDCDDDAFAMLEDVVTALGLDDTLGGTVERITIDGYSINSIQKENKIASGLLTFSVIYRTDRFAL